VEKLLPQNAEAESGVLGSIIIDPEAIVQIADFLQAEDFYRDAHRTIYEVIIYLYQNREPADLITICDELSRRNKLDEVGGPGYITSLINQIPTSINAEHYARIVERNAILRRLIQAAGDIAAVAYEEVDANVALEHAEQLIFSITQRHARSDFSALSELLVGYMEKLDLLQNQRGAIVGVPTGFTDLDRLTGGLQRSDLIILAARPAMGKCLTARTLIDDPETGERLTIEECVQRRMPRIYGVSDTGQVRSTDISDWIDSGIQPCYRVQTLSGRMVEVTGHHPFLTVNGWLPLHDLQVGQHIAVPTSVPAFGNDESLPLAKVRLLAYLIAEGGLTGNSPSFTNTDPVLIKDFQQIIATHFPTCAIRQERITYTVAQQKESYTKRGIAILPANPLTLWLKELDLMGKLAKDKFFPACAWRWSRGYMAEFIRTLMSCDGSIYSLQGKPRIEFCVPSPQLAADLHHALIRFGITAKYNKSGKNAWRVAITSPESIKKYQQEIGWIGEKTTRFAYAEVINNSVLRRSSSKDIYWDKIVSIEPIGEHQVYDLSVPDGANFVAQDVFVHNTSLALSLAHNSALRHKRSIAIFSLEMSKEQLLQRLISMEAGIDQQRLRTGWIEDDEWDRIIESMGRLSEANIWIDDTAGISTTEMRSKARRLQAEHGVDMVIVDYLQLMQSAPGSARNRNREQEISEISRNLKGLARELNIPVLALAQLSRAVESRQSKVPQLSDLRESGCLTGDTPVYLPDEGIYRPIASLVEQKDFRVLALNSETWQYERRTVANAFSTGHKPVYKLTTRLGRTIRTTANHKFLTIYGWRRLDELKVNERIAVPRHLQGPISPTMSKEEQQSDVYWDEISTIEPDGEADVYDLTVDGLHNFVAGDITVHNSIEQDADIVMFIYRDDVYNPDTERKNIADIIIAKHRNGPVGEVSLYFQANQTRFRDLEVSPPTDE
jgi:replicative DNA helicase